MKRFYINLRLSILAAFSALLFLSFALVGAAFNLAVHQYVRNSAIEQLNESRLSLIEILNQSMIPLESADPLYPATVTDNDPHRNIFRTHLNAFILDAEYRFVDQQRMPSDAQAIAEILRGEKVNLATLSNRRVKTGHRTYYITAANTTLFFQDTTPIYMIYYVDVTDVTQFAASVNLLLLTLVGSIWLVSVGITTLLAGTISRPIRSLGRFAERIGNGDFSTSPVVFRNIEFDSLNQCLNRTAKQLAQYDNEQKTFFQNVSHELRTPLMSIKCYAEGIQYGLMEPVAASQTILNETDRLTQMVDDLLYVSKIDNITTTHVYEYIDIRDLIQAAVNQQRAVAEKDRVQIIVETGDKPVMMNCVAKNITRALSNLISNAIRYAETTLWVTCAGHPDTVTVKVIDDGPGIETALLPHVFERFCKGKGGQHGIGLSIVKLVAEQHKGTVTAQNNHPKGAILTLTLPRAGQGGGNGGIIHPR